MRPLATCARALSAHAIHDDPDVITANSTRPSGQARVVDGGYRLTGRWSAAASSRHGWSCGRSSMKKVSRAQHRRASRRSASCCCPPANARSSKPGQSEGCAVPAVPRCELSTGACFSRCTYDDAAHRRTPAGHAVDWPGIVRPRTGYPASLTAAIPTVTASAVPCSTPIESTQSSSTAETSAKTFKRDYCVVGRPDVVSVFRQLDSGSSIPTAQPPALQ